MRLAVPGSGPRVPSAEATVFQSGRRNPLVRFDGHTAAMAVCADTGRPSHAREAAARGAKNCLASMFVIPAAVERDTARLRAFAVRHHMAVVFANFGGPSGGLLSGGRSAIVSAKGEVLAQLPPRGAGIAVAIEPDTGWRARQIISAG